MDSCLSQGLDRDLNLSDDNRYANQKINFIYFLSL